MKNLFSKSERKQKRLSIKVFAATCLLVFSILFSSLSAFAVTLSLTVNAQRSTSDLCGGNKVCCVTFTMDIPNGTTLDKFTFTLSGGTPPQSPEDCWNLSCAGTHATPSGYTSLIADHQTVSFDYTNGGMNPGLVGPATFSFILCPVDGAGCDGNWPTLTWWDENEPTGGGTITHQGPTAETIPGNNCNSNTDCKGCDQIDAFPVGSCVEEVCFTEHWPNTAGISGFVLHVSPALPAYPCTPTGCGSASPSMDASNPTGWTTAPNLVANGGGTDIVVSGTPNLTGCQTVCVKIPKCGSTSHTITLTSVTPGSTTCPNTLTGVSFKMGGSIETTDLDNTSQNYPNPLSVQTQFKTVIPFAIANEGMAKVSVFDESGRVVFKDIQNFAGSGRHFFYFTGSELPAGKYFYTIESPLGAIIVEKSLLIVK